MAQIIYKTFDYAAGTISVLLRDALGAEHALTVHLDSHRCPMCQSETHSAGADVEQAIAKVSAEMDARAERLIPIFEKHGATVKREK